MLEIRGARLEELKAAAECIGAAFIHSNADYDEFVDAFRRSLDSDTRFDPANTRLVLQDGQVVAVAQIADRQMLLAGKAVRMAVLPWVGVLPEFQGRGIGSLLMLHVVDYLQEQGYVTAMIFAEGVERFYERFGWRRIPKFTRLRLSLPQTIAEPAFDGELRPADLERDLYQILEVWAEFNRDATGPAVPTREFWLTYNCQAPLEFPRFIVAERGGQVVAYLRSGYRRAIVALGARQGHEEALPALTAYACHQAREAGQVVLYAVNLPGLGYALETAGIPNRLEPVRGHQVRVIRPDLLIATLLPAMRERWQKAGLGSLVGLVRIESEAGHAALRAHDGQLSLAQDSAPDETNLLRLRLTHAQMINLFMGQARTPDLWVESILEREQIQAALGAFFPPVEYRWYPKDTF